VVPADQPATIVFTSGSSTEPKAVLHSLGNHYFNATGSNDNLPVEPGDRWLLALPIYHVGGLAIVFRCLLSGATVVLEDRSLDLAEQIRRDNITHLSLVPTQFRRLMASPEFRQSGSQVKHILVGGGPIPSGLLEQARETGLPIYPTYGLTEMASQVATGSPSAPNSAGVLKHRQLKVADDGEILVRGKTLFLGYVDGEQVQRPLDTDGWFHTGDIGRLDEHGCLTVIGRKDNMFISGGENIHPEQIENALKAIDGIEEALVVPVDDAEFGQRPVAFLKYESFVSLSECESGVDEEDKFKFDHLSLTAELEKTLPRFMIPIAFYPWPETYRAPGIKIERSFFESLAARLIRTRM
jgi:O-succinylbenzoic acid--CoA ligase